MWNRVCAGQGRSEAVVAPVPPLPSPPSRRTETEGGGTGPGAGTQVLSLPSPEEMPCLGDETFLTQATFQSCLMWAVTSSLSSPMPVTSALCPAIADWSLSAPGDSHQPPKKESLGPILSLSHSRGNFGTWARCRLGCIAGLRDPLVLSPRLPWHWFLNCVL